MAVSAADVYIANAGEQTADFAYVLRTLLKQVHHLSVFDKHSLEPSDPARDSVHEIAAAAAVGERHPGVWLCRRQTASCVTPLADNFIEPVCECSDGSARSCGHRQS